MLEQRALGEILVRHGVVAPDTLEPLYEQQREKKATLIDLLLQAKVAGEVELGKALAAECGLQFVDRIDVDLVPIDVGTRLPIGFCRARRLIVVGEDERHVTVVCADPLATDAVDGVRASFGKSVNLAVSSVAVVADAINRIYERKETASDLKSDDERAEEETEDILDSDEDAPIIRWVNSLFSQAVKERASDIHIEPEEKEVLVRYRVDGQLYVARKASRQFMSSVVARVKIMAGLNIAEKRLPQDGRISLKIAGRAIDVRVSSIPTSRDHERIVMRLLHKSNVLLDLTELGFSQRDYYLMDRIVRKPNGIVLVTGPTGSGKTTTLYACLNRINRPEINILTAEDPVEYEIGGIHQVAVKPSIGLTFAGALRAFLRQDPDVIMVGETRDRETADIAMRASMTGHLVLSTLHTNDAASAFTRLVDMGIEPFLVRTTVVGILAQRLVRRLCPQCKVPYEATPAELEELGCDRERTAARQARELGPAYRVHGVEYRAVGWTGVGPRPTFYQARGCAACEGKGYAGRMGIYELLLADDAVGSLVLRNADGQTIRRAAQTHGMETLRDDGARKVFEGVTTVEEVLSKTQEDLVEE